MIVLAGNQLALRQALIKGRISEAITGRGLPVNGAVLDANQGGTPAHLPTSVVTKPGGYFAIHFDPGRDMPDLSGGGPVTLTLRLTVPDRDPVEIAQVIPAADLSVVSQEVTVAGQSMTVRSVAGAPFDFAASLAPDPVALAGIVLREHDPSDPIEGVEVRADGGPPATTDAGGRFFIAALPIAETVTLSLLEGAAQTDVPYRPDYARRVNTVTLSLDS